MFGAFGAGVSNMMYGKGSEVQASTVGQSPTPTTARSSTNQSAQALKAKMAAKEGQYVGARAEWSADAAASCSGGAGKGRIPSPPRIRVPVNYPGQSQAMPSRKPVPPSAAMLAAAKMPTRKPVPSRPAQSADVEFADQESEVDSAFSPWPARYDSLRSVEHGNDGRKGSSPPYMSGADFEAFSSDPTVRAAVARRYNTYNAAQPQGFVLAPGDIQNGHIEQFPSTGVGGQATAAAQNDEVVYSSPKVSAWSDSSSAESAVPFRKGLHRVSKFTELMSPTGSVRRMEAPVAATIPQSLQIGAPTFLSRANARQPIGLLTLEQAQANKGRHGQADFALEHLSRKGAFGQMTEAHKRAAGIAALERAGAHDARAKASQAKVGSQTTMWTIEIVPQRSETQKRKGLNPKNAAGSYLNILGRSKSGASKVKTQQKPAAPAASRVPDTRGARMQDVAVQPRQVVGRASQTTLFSDFINAAVEEQRTAEKQSNADMVPAPLNIHKDEARADQSFHAGIHDCLKSPTGDWRAAEARMWQASARQQAPSGPRGTKPEVSAAPSDSQQALNMPSTIQEEANAAGSPYVPSLSRAFDEEKSMALPPTTSPDHPAREVPARKQVDLSVTLPPRPASVASDFECASPKPYRSAAIDAWLATTDDEQASRAAIYESSHRPSEARTPMSEYGSEIIVDTFVNEKSTVWRVTEKRT